MSIYCKIILTLPLIISILTLKSFAAFIDRESIIESGAWIQVGAYKNISALNVVERELFEYDLFVTTKDKINRIYIVNILDKQELNLILKRVKKLYPDSFIYMDSLNDNIDKNIEDTKWDIEIIQSTEERVESIENSTSILDSDAILKTRKRFF